MIEFDPSMNRRNVLIKGTGLKIKRLPEPTMMHYANPLTQLLQPGLFQAAQWNNDKF
jgi:hypothetical protein